MSYITSIARRFMADERAQDAFEYVLVLGAITVAVIIAVATPVGGNIITAVVRATCAAIDTIPLVSATLTCP